MPLSDHEQRLLEQMERALYAEDPKFASSMRGADLRRRYRRRAIVAAFVFLLGIVVLMTGAVTGVIPLGVGGFVVMLVSAWYAVISWRRVPSEGEIGTFEAGTDASAGPARKSGRSSAAARRGFMERMEERWRRRRERGPGR
ncbi:MAG TPA: DUF3040 domain-containing protein [Jiangellaceae bacterium]|nr:DUF3040 domain-containing protein [Jiangellaceae bacterium]